MARYLAPCWIALAVLICGACRGGDGPIVPTPALAPVTPSTVAVHMEGRVIDADRKQPIPGAIVTTVQVCYPGACREVDQPVSVRADENGTVFLTASLPQGWNELQLGVAPGAGYESANIYVSPSSAGAAVLEVYPTLTIEPGGSIQTRAFLKHYVCGWLSAYCRRVVVESPAGESVDLEATPADGEADVGLDADGDVFEDHGFPRRLTVSGGEVWIVGAPVTVTLTARRH
jgi:hypothetical protein